MDNVTLAPIPTRSSTSRGLAFIHAAVFLFGLAGLLGKMVDCPPVVVVFARALLAALVLSPAIFRGGTAWNGQRQGRRWLAGSGILLAVHWLTFFQAIQVSTVALGLLGFSTYPVFVIFLEALVSRQWPHALDASAAFVVMAGLALITPDLDLAHHLTQGVAWGTCSGFTFALLTMLNRRLVQRTSSLTIAAAQNGWAALILGPFLAVAEWHLTGRDLLLLAVLGVVCTACAHALFIQGLTVVRAQTASILTALEPVYGILLAWLIVQEQPAVRTLGGGLLILAAAVVISRRNRSLHE